MLSRSRTMHGMQRAHWGNEGESPVRRRPGGAPAAWGVLLALAACAKHDPPAPSPESQHVAAAASPALARHGPAATATRAAGPIERQGLPWYEDAPEAVFAAARAAGKLVLVDLWAPWCHSCLSMQSFVLTAA
ncbi:MAG: thioredoxin family protein, partial [Deltaproteobacteria bacterium]